ncbi:GNAT family N-acetyltransferase [Oceanicola sp. 22II-s10i]|uniref:GNAT family N-acetyltransferase n=1 Tax=Oceanicola sp. 22II-s10i TaxID=1317116 RepID=UPI000B51F1E7|nr:GNAT family N-acetyltransferase [Oceanicola sp. 22II-s10i]
MNAADTLTTHRLILRRPEPADFEPFCAFMMSDRTRFLGGPKSRRIAFDRLANFAGHWVMRGYGRYIVTDRATGRPLGHAGAFQHDDTIPPEMAWSLWSADDEGRGLAREAAAETLRHYRADLGWPVVCARIHRDNAGSIAIARQLGGTQVPHDEGDTLRFDIALAQRGAA